MSRQRATFGKLQRERDKQAKAKAKRERRQATAEEADEAGQDQPQASEQSAQAVIDLVAGLHQRFENHEISFETYEEQKAELLSRLRVD